MQAMIDGMSAQWQSDRAATQMTLGDMIKRLEELPEELKIVGVGEIDSYRGYYSDLAFCPDGDNTAGELLVICKSAMGKVFTGYKGGDFMMGESTPLWIASYSECGQKLISIFDDGKLKTEEDED